MTKQLGMTEGEFAEVFVELVKDHIALGWEITGLDIGEITVKTDHGRTFRLVVTIDDET